MGQVVKSPQIAEVTEFIGGKNTRLAPHFLSVNESQTSINADPTGGILTPLKDVSTVASDISGPNIMKYKGSFIYTDEDRDYVEYGNRLYWSNGTQPKKHYEDPNNTGTYLTQNLGIEYPNVTASQLLVATGVQNYSSASYLAGNFVVTVNGTNISVYQFINDTLTFKCSYTSANVNDDVVAWVEGNYVIIVTITLASGRYTAFSYNIVSNSVSSGTTYAPGGIKCVYYDPLFPSQCYIGVKGVGNLIVYRVTCTTSAVATISETLTVSVGVNYGPVKLGKIETFGQSPINYFGICLNDGTDAKIGTLSVSPTGLLTSGGGGTLTVLTTTGFNFTDAAFSYFSGNFYIYAIKSGQVRSWSGATIVGMGSSWSSNEPTLSTNSRICFGGSAYEFYLSYVSNDASFYHIELQQWKGTAFYGSGRIAKIATLSLGSVIADTFADVKKIGNYILHSNYDKGLAIYDSTVSPWPYSIYSTYQITSPNGTYDYAIAFYNSTDGTLSVLMPFINNVIVQNQLLTLSNIPQPTDTQVTHIRIYRVGGTISAFSLVGSVSVGTTTFDDTVSDGDIGETYDTTIDRYPAETNLLYLTESYGRFWGAVDDKLYYTDPSNPNYWSPYYISFGRVITGIGVLPNCIIVFTATQTFVVSGAGQSFVKYRIDESLGCLLHKSIRLYKGRLYWLSYDGLCVSNGGLVEVYSKGKLKKFELTSPVQAAIYDEVYYLSHSAGVFVSDFRFGQPMFYDLSITGLKCITNIDDTLYASLGASVPVLDGPIYAMIKDGVNIYIGGNFTTVNGAAAQGIAKYDGAAWSALGPGITGSVNSLTVDGSGNLYAGGYFTTAGGVSANRIAKWNGSAWSALGPGMNGGVTSLAFYGGSTLYAGGYFTTAGGVSVNYVAKWNGSTWSALGPGMDGAVNSLVTDGSGNLYAGGAFTTAGGVSVNKIAKWNGSTWSALSTGMDGAVNSLVIDGSGNLYAGGTFTTAGGVTVNGISKWNGAAWSALGAGTDGGVNSLAFDGSGNLYAVGLFATAGGVTVNNIAKWNGTVWSALGSGVGAIAGSIVYYSGKLIVSGAFSGGITVFNGVTYTSTIFAEHLQLFGGSQNLTVTRKSGWITHGDLTASKTYTEIRVSCNASYTLNIYINGALKKAFTHTSSGAQETVIHQMPAQTVGYYMEFEFITNGNILSFESKAMVQKVMS